MIINNIDKNKLIHMVGIGGVSMSGIAEILLSMGYKVSGSNITQTDVTERLEKSGIKIYYAHKPENVLNAGIVVYTAAIKQDNPELVKARELGIPTIERAEFLGELTKLYNETIAISGTHGKTTTTSMISVIFMQAGKDPTIQVGADLKQLNNTNYRVGSSPYFVVEACEYVESFLKFAPKTAIVLNIEEDHLDYYKDLNHIKSAFNKFINLVPTDGNVILNYDDENCIELSKNIHSNLVTFAIDNENATWVAKNIHLNENGYYSFTAVSNSESIDITLNVLGKHNIYNALSAIATAKIYGIDNNSIIEGIKEFTGAHRRFEYMGDYNGARIYNDYAHHPTEIKATIKSANMLPHKRIIAVFQPHTFSRTITLFDEFSKAFKECDEVILADIYPAREIDTGIVSSKKLSEAINQISNNCNYIGDKNDIVNYLKQNLSEKDIVLFIGAGDIYKLGDEIRHI